jgi:RNA polymerase sigma factor for flagellar operon FliA
MTTIERNFFILNHLSLAENLARKKSRTIPKFIDFEEIKSAAYSGLVEAATAFKPSYGVPFIAYAIKRIYGAINDFLREQSWGPRGSNIAMKSLEFDPSKESKDDFSLLIESLGEQDKKIMEMYYIWGFTLKEIGNKIGVNESRVCQMMSESKRNLAKI